MPWPRSASTSSLRPSDRSVRAGRGHSRPLPIVQERLMKQWNTWGVVIASGLLIIASWLTGSDLLMIAAAAVAGYRIAISAYQALRIKTISIDLLVIVAAVGALFIHNYWESAAVTFLFALGGALERATLNRTRQALSDLVEAAPETATVLRDGEPQTVEVWELVPGDIVLIRNGEQVPVDGTVVSGHGGVDEASITGESVPAEKAKAQRYLPAPGYAPACCASRPSASEPTLPWPESSIASRTPRMPRLKRRPSWRNSPSTTLRA